MASIKRAKKLFNKNFLTIFGLVVTLLASYVIYRLSYDLPDLRYVKGLPPQAIDYRLDEEGNLVTLMSFKALLKNLSFKSGYVDKVEYIPQSLDIVSKLQLISVDKEPIAWREEKVVEIRMTMSVNRQEAVKIAEALEVTKIGAKEIWFEQRLYDNTGKQIPTSLTGGREPIKVSLVLGSDRNKFIELMTRQVLRH